MNRESLNGLPWWVKGIATVGFPTVVALFFLAQSAGWIPSATQATASTLERLVKNTEAHEQTTRDLIDRLSTALRAMCENAARDVTERNRCQHIH